MMRKSQVKDDSRAIEQDKQETTADRLSRLIAEDAELVKQEHELQRRLSQEEVEDRAGVLLQGGKLRHPDREAVLLDLKRIGDDRFAYRQAIRKLTQDVDERRVLEGRRVRASMEPERNKLMRAYYEGIKQARAALDGIDRMNAELTGQGFAPFDHVPFPGVMLSDFDRREAMFRDNLQLRGIPVQEIGLPVPPPPPKIEPRPQSAEMQRAMQNRYREITLMPDLPG